MSLVLYRFPLCPFGKIIRILIDDLKFSEQLINTKSQFQKLKTSQLPILEEDKNIYINFGAILCFLKKEKKLEILLEADNDTEISSFEFFINNTFYREVYCNTIYEKTEKLFYEDSFNHNIAQSKFAYKQQNIFLNKINNILEYRDWINNNYSINDISLFSFLSSLDYFGQIDWYNFSALKTWFSRLKSISPFSKILQERIIGINPPKNYENPDF